MSKNFKNGFTMLELMLVIVIIGILSSLAYAGMSALIQTNKAKEVAREMTSFVERAIAEGKVRQKDVTISINNNTLQAQIDGETISITQTLASGFSASSAATPGDCGSNLLNENGIVSQYKIGISGVSGSGCFVVCNSGGRYCGGTVKSLGKNKFAAQVKKPSSGWEVL